MDLKGTQTAAGNMPGPHDPPRLGGDRRRDAGGASQAEIILIPKQLRAEWMDVMARDPDLSPLCYKVAGLIGSFFNRRTGDTFVSQERLAKGLRLGLRTIQLAIAELERRGYLIVKRRELGTRSSDGRRVCGGRGVANTYLPAFERGQLSATNSGRRLVERAEETWREMVDGEAAKVAPECVLSGAEGRTGMRPLPGERTQNQAGKVALECVPTLNHPSDDNPPRGRAGARGDAPAHPLGKAMASALSSWIGEAAFRTWFGDAQLAGSDGETLTVMTPSRFNRDYLDVHFSDAVLQCWNRTNPPVRFVTFKVRP